MGASPVMVKRWTLKLRMGMGQILSGWDCHAIDRVMIDFHPRP